MYGLIVITCLWRNKSKCECRYGNELSTPTHTLSLLSSLHVMSSKTNVNCLYSVVFQCLRAMLWGKCNIVYLFHWSGALRLALHACCLLHYSLWFNIRINTAYIYHYVICFVTVSCVLESTLHVYIINIMCQTSFVSLVTSSSV